MHNFFNIPADLDYLSAIRQYLAYVFFNFANLIVWTLMFPVNEDKPSNETIARIFGFLFTSSIIYAIEKLFLHIFSARFQLRAYADRMEKIIKSTLVLEKLSRGVRKRKTMQNFPGLFSDSKNSSESDLANQGRKASQFNFEIAAKAKEIGSGLLDVSKALAGIDLNSSLGIKSFGDPYKLSKRLFIGIRTGSSQSLFLQDFEEFFDDLDEAVEAFKVFDGDSNGDVTRAEFRKGIVDIFENADTLEASILQSNSAMGKIDNIMMFFVYVIILFVGLGVFEVDTAAFLALSISLWAGLLFAVGGVVKVSHTLFNYI
jgi:hypothetical protein